MGTGFKEFELSGWQSVADGYAEYFSSLTGQTVEPVLDAAGVSTGMEVLDVASGPGIVAAAAAERGAQVTGVDFSAVMVEMAGKNYPGIQFELGDAEELQLGDGSFDAVVMNFGLLHLEQPEKAVSEAYRVLRKGGRFAFSVWALPEDAKAFGIVLRAIERHGNLQAAIPAGPPFFRFSDVGKTVVFMREAGFVDPQGELVRLRWELGKAEDLFEAFYTGTPRTGGLLRAQTEEQLSAIRAAVTEAAKGFRSGDRVVIPMAAVVYSGRKN